MNTLTPNEKKTLEVLRFSSKRHPITGKKIANSIGLPYRVSGMEGADMRAIIHDLRIKGFPICAGGKGYWLTKSEAELNKFIWELKARIKSQKEVLAGLEKSRAKVKTITEEQRMKEVCEIYLR